MDLPITLSNSLEKTGSQILNELNEYLDYWFISENKRICHQFSKYISELNGCNPIKPISRIGCLNINLQLKNLKNIEISLSRQTLQKLLLLITGTKYLPYPI